MSFWNSLHNPDWSQAYAAWAGVLVAFGAMAAAIYAAAYAVKTYNPTNDSWQSAKQQSKLQLRSFYDSTMPIIVASLENPRVSWTKNLEEYGDFTKANSGFYPIPITEAGNKGWLAETFTIRLKNTSDNPGYIEPSDLGEWMLFDPDTREPVQGELSVTSDRERVLAVKKQINPIRDGYLKDAVGRFTCSLQITNRARNTKDTYALDSDDVNFMTWGSIKGLLKGHRLKQIFSSPTGLRKMPFPSNRDNTHLQYEPLGHTD